MAADLRFERVIQASPELLFRAFTNTVALTEWLCDRALVTPRPGGPFFVAWNQGYSASGAYQQVMPNEAVSFSWSGRDDPAVTQVSVSFSPEESGTRVVLVHSGFGSQEGWERAWGEIHKGWENGLENLASVLEQGPDLRIANRPMMGLLFGEFNAKIAERLGVPVTEGMRLEGTIEGMGAQKAGLRKDDVLVEMNGQPVKTFEEVGKVIQGKKAGDQVTIAYFRGAEKQTAQMELSRRSLPGLPASAGEFADMVEKIYQEDQHELRRVLAGVTDAEGAKKPAEQEWSINEVLAHLVQNERMAQIVVLSVVYSFEPFGEGFADNFYPWVKATAETYGSTSVLMDELCRLQAETVMLIRGLPDSVTSRKSSFWRLAFNMLSFPFHGKEHAEQITAAVAAVRK